MITHHDIEAMKDENDTQRSESAHYGKAEGTGGVSPLMALPIACAETIQTMFEYFAGRDK